jgi:preprotein translocase subunit SecA
MSRDASTAQLRGRCARQGDPGMSRFYVSFEDDLMRNFGAADRMTKMMERFGLEEGQELEHPWLNRSVETAQKRVEQRNYLIRKRTLEFDDVMNKQRKSSTAFATKQSIPTIRVRSFMKRSMRRFRKRSSLTFHRMTKQNPHGLLNWVNTTFPLGLTMEAARFDKSKADEVSNYLIEKIKHSYELKCRHEELDAVRHLERYIILNAIDRLWQEHLYAMDALREAVYLRAYGQKDPLVEYKNEAFEMFTELMGNIKGEILHNLFRSTSNLMAFEHFLASLPMHLLGAEAPTEASPAGPRQREVSANDGAEETTISLPIQRETPKVGRNNPCPCGSGKKYKNCCGRNA